MKEKARMGGARPIGVFLGSAGALLDFYSGYQLLTQGGMAGPSDAWGAGILLLGVVLAVTALAMAYPSWTDLMADFGSLMLVYGAVMLFIGGMMYSGRISMMQGGVESGIGMVMVGALMLVNGAWMRRAPAMKVAA